jgi:hypothetical protein
MLRLLVGSMTVRFDPMIVFLTLGVCGVLVIGRLLLGWAMRE